MIYQTNNYDELLYIKQLKFTNRKLSTDTMYLHKTFVLYTHKFVLE